MQIAFSLSLATVLQTMNLFDICVHHNVKETFSIRQQSKQLQFIFLFTVYFCNRQKQRQINTQQTLIPRPEMTLKNSHLNS